MSTQRPTTLRWTVTGSDALKQMPPFPPLSPALCCLLVLSGCQAPRGALTGAVPLPTLAVKRDTSTWVDHARNRKVPVALYRRATAAPVQRQPVVLLNHGYNQNRPGSYLRYSYLAEQLAAKGYVVVSIQHELPTDSLIPATGIPQVVRRPFWDRGADNMQFVLQQLQHAQPGLDFRHVALIGHSNGGDMVALFAQKYPGRVARLITLYNRRMALPRTKHRPRVYSLRSSDQPADAGVVPAPAEQKRLRMTIIPLAHTRHDEMDDHATTTQRQEINAYILRFLQQ